MPNDKAISLDNLQTFKTNCDSTYATKTELTEGLAGKQPTGNYALQTGTYPNMTVGNATNAANATNAVNAESAASAATATKATQDGSGNNIAETYATKSEVEEGLAGKQPTGDYALQTGNYPSLSVGYALNADQAMVANAATSASLATKDGDGNVITSTYPKKTSFNTKGANYVSYFESGVSGYMDIYTSGRTALVCFSITIPAGMSAYTTKRVLSFSKIPELKSSTGLFRNTVAYRTSDAWMQACEMTITQEGINIVTKAHALEGTEAVEGSCAYFLAAWRE